MENQFNQNTAEVVSLKDWLITLLILCIPLVNIVMMFVWAFGASTNPSKANYFKAQLIFVAVSIVLTIILWGTIFASVLSSMGSMY